MSLKIQIKVVNKGNEKIEVNLPKGKDTSVPELKAHIQATKGYAVEAQRLIFQGQILKDETSLNAYRIENDSVLHLSLKPGIAASKPAPAPTPTSTSASTGTETSSSTTNPATSSASFDHLLQQAKARNSNPSQFQGMVAILERIVSNILAHPNEEKYRKLRMTNAALKAKVFDLPFGMDCVKALGFEERIEEGYLVLVPSAEKWIQLEGAKTTIAQVKASAATPSPGFNAGNTAASPSALGGMSPEYLQSLMQNPMMQQMAQGNPMMQQMLQNPAMIQQAMRMMQQNPALIQQVMQNMQNPNGMAQMQQMMSGMGMGGAPTSSAAPGPMGGQPSTNPFTPSSASSSSQPAQSSTPAPGPTPSTSNENATTSATPSRDGAQDSSTDELEEQEIAEAIARSLREQ